MNMQRNGMIALLIAGLATLSASAGDWPQFLGPDRDSVSRETGLLSKFPAAGPKVLWTAKLGSGFGGAAVAGGAVHVLDRNEQRDIFRVLDLRRGTEQWRHAYDAPGRASHAGSRSTPTIDGDRAYTVGSFGHVYCFDLKKRKPLWHFQLRERHGEQPLKWAVAQSPLVYRDLLLVNPMTIGEPATVAMDKKTGVTRWKSEAFGGDFYSSPVVRTIAGVQGVLQIFSNSPENNLVLFLDPETGETIWKYTDYGVKWSIPAPTVLPDGKHVFITGGYDAGSVMIAVEKSGSGFNVEKKWSIESGSQLHPAIPVGNVLYANINENATLRRSTMGKGGLACIRPADGKILWRTGAEPNFNRGHVLLADGKLIVLDGKIGDLVLIKPDPAGYRELDRANLFPEKKGNEIWAPMALANGLLVLRDQFELKCVDLRAASPSASADHREPFAAGNGSRGQ